MHYPLPSLSLPSKPLASGRSLPSPGSEGSAPHLAPAPEPSQRSAAAVGEGWQEQRGPTLPGEGC